MVAKIDSPTTPLEQTEKTNEIIDDLGDKLYRSEFNGVRSNCITYIPKDIEVELNNGTITLKAGSKVYVPNGVGVFDEVVIESDLSRNTWGSGSNQLIVSYRKSTSNWGGFELSKCYSGATAPSGSTDMIWYDTTNNKVKVTSNGGSTWTDDWSLPIFIINRSSGSISSIDQIFNGFGYIGSTVFALPGVKGLIPDGRNEDGTLKNIEWIINNVITRTFTSTGKNYKLVCDGNSVGFSTEFYYNDISNYVENSGTKASTSIFSSCDLTSGVISNFTPKTVFHALDWNDKGTIAGFGMPSDRYIDLTLGASGTSYKAPANGYVLLMKVGNQNQYAQIACGIIILNTSPYNGGIVSIWLPVKKGNSFTVNYDLSGSTNFFRFYYAEGEQ